MRVGRPPRRNLSCAPGSLPEIDHMLQPQRPRPRLCGKTGAGDRVQFTRPGKGEKRGHSYGSPMEILWNTYGGPMEQHGSNMGAARWQHGCRWLAIPDRMVQCRQELESGEVAHRSCARCFRVSGFGSPLRRAMTNCDASTFAATGTLSFGERVG